MILINFLFFYDYPFGLEAPLDIPDTKEKIIYYDSTSMYKSLYILNIDFQFDNIEIIMKEPNGNTYSRKYKNSELKLIKDIYTMGPDDARIKFTIPVIYVKFNNQACFNDGDWDAIVKFDDKEVINNKVKIKLDGPTVISTEKINPLKDFDPFSFNNGDELFIYGVNEKKNKEIIVAIYYNTEKKLGNQLEFGDKFNCIIPVIATKIKTDNKGRFNLKYKIGIDMPKGNYYIATGTKIEYYNELYGNFMIQ